MVSTRSRPSSTRSSRTCSRRIAMTCEWQGKIVVNTLATDNKEVQWTETENLGKYWDQVQRPVRSTRRSRSSGSVVTTTLDTMKQMATVWHDEAEKTKSRRDLRARGEGLRGASCATFPEGQGRATSFSTTTPSCCGLWRPTTTRKGQGVPGEGSRSTSVKAHEQFVQDPRARSQGQVHLETPPTRRCWR